MVLAAAFLVLVPLAGLRFFSWPAGGCERSQSYRRGPARAGASLRRRAVGENAAAEEGADAPARASLAWSILQAEADVQAESVSGREGRNSLEDRAAALLVDSALDRLRPYLDPSNNLCELATEGGRAALSALLGEDSRYITDFLSEAAEMTGVHEAFWQGELYLQSLHSQAGEAPVQSTMRELEAETEAAEPELSRELDDSLLLARQNYISTARFGYFVRRCRQRLALERTLGGGAAGGLEQYVQGVPPADIVELTRVSTHEASLAVEHRATCLFGDFRELLDPNPRNIRKLQLSQRDAELLTIEAAAFGAGLFEAEEAAARRYDLTYTAFGSRNERP